MYKFSNKECTLVTNKNTGISGIHPGVWLWEDYQKWVAAGGITEAYDTRTPEEILSITKDTIWEKIKAERTKRKDGGFKVNGKWFHSDQPSRIQHLGLVMLGASLPQGVIWKTMDSSFIQLTPLLVTQIFQEGLRLDTMLFGVAEVHKQDMEASSTPETYDFSTGWPENFLGV